MTDIEELRTIKRQKIEAQSSIMTTKCTTDWNFSHEILCLIFQHLNNKDIISLSCVNRSFRQMLKPYVFKDVKLTWGMIESKFSTQKSTQDSTIKDDDGTLKSFKDYTEIVKIIEPNLQQEWSFRFHRLFEAFQNMVELSLVISSSSNFLKYNELMINLKTLTIKTNNPDSNFNINHLRQFPNLKTLTLDGFRIDFDEDDAKEMNLQCFRNLTLINCSWHYPFQLSFWSNSENIESLNLIYSNQFILSERFREFLHNPALPKLQYLTVLNQNAGLKLHITYRIYNFLKNIPNLKRLYLIGNIDNETLNHYTAFDLENKLRYCLNVNDVKIFYSSFVQ